MARDLGNGLAHNPDVRPVVGDVYHRPQWHWNEQLHIVYVRDLGLVDVRRERCSYVQCEAGNLLRAGDHPIRDGSVRIEQYHLPGRSDQHDGCDCNLQPHGDL